MIITQDPFLWLADLYELFISCRTILTHNLGLLPYTYIKVMKNVIVTITVIVFFLVFLCASITVRVEAQNKGKRGDEPQCQNACLKEHSEKMALFEKGLSKTGDRFTYQDRIEEEEHRYARCLTNCREVIPVK